MVWEGVIESELVGNGRFPACSRGNGTWVKTVCRELVWVIHGVGECWQVTEAANQEGEKSEKWG